MVEDISLEKLMRVANIRSFAEIVQLAIDKKGGSQKNIDKILETVCQEVSGPTPPVSVVRYHYNNPGYTPDTSFREAAGRVLLQTYGYKVPERKNTRDQQNTPQNQICEHTSEKKVINKKIKTENEDNSRYDSKGGKKPTEQTWPGEEKRTQKVKIKSSKKRKKELSASNPARQDELHLEDKATIEIDNIKKNIKKKLPPDNMAPRFTIYALANGIKERKIPDPKDNSITRYKSKSDIADVLQIHGQNPKDFKKEYAKGKVAVKKHNLESALKGASYRILEALIDILREHAGEGKYTEDIMLRIQRRKRICEPINYEPDNVYERGQLILYRKQLGVVYDKEHKDKIFVMFVDGTKRVLKENEPYDAVRLRPNADLDNIFS